ncbi:MAG: hypothetical protein JW775_12690, partial [Candidatus Aminicenantes bacterium]|nr:hypothetical protein [Candidatus Aminicenantes bacterium]
MATEFKYKNPQEFLGLIPRKPDGKLYADEEELFAASLGDGPGGPKNGSRRGRGLNSPEDIEQTADLVKIYLREMGSILLLSR